MSREDRMSEATGIQSVLALDPGLRRGDGFVAGMTHYVFRNFVMP